MNMQRMNKHHLQNIKMNKHHHVDEYVKNKYHLQDHTKNKHHLQEDRYQEWTPLFKNIQITTPCSHDFAFPSNFALKDFMEVCEEVATNLQILLDFMCVLGGACFYGAWME
jgi:hypothetical protein